ncbi:MAG: phosphoribosylamine--glycine ligase [Bacteroidota bacterium]
MNVLILGSGGREHALAWKIAASPLLEKLYIAPGNGGTMETGINLPVSETDFNGIKQIVLDKKIGLVVVGPEAPLVAGISDFFHADPELRNIPVIGPEKSGARLEGSKDFAKAFMTRHGIPTARFKTFTRETLADGKKFLHELKAPYVLKADGLAAGKGVLIIDSLTEAESELEKMLGGKFGAASEKVVIEEFLKGIELSVFVLTDGKSYVILPEAKDYKRIGEGDTGLNTGGMGAVSPVSFADARFMKKVEERIVIPTIEGLKKESIPFCGFLFLGLIKVDGEPMMIEYNVRMGDPETEVVMPRIQSDFLDLLHKAGTGKLAGTSLTADPRTVTTVMLVSGGYPGNYEKGKIIKVTETNPEYILFHAGTKKEDSHLLTSGGRVISVSAYGKDISDALKKSYAGASRVDFEGLHYRKDIGFDLV